MTAVAAVRRGFGALSWFVAGVLGEDAYDKYLAHFDTHNVDGAAEPMTAREFWRDNTDRQDDNPQGRCC